MPYQERVRLSWQDERGDTKYADARCIDVSERGISVEIAEPVGVACYVSLRSDRLRLAGSAAVRYCRRKAGKYLVGLEFAAGLRCELIPAATLPLV